MKTPEEYFIERSLSLEKNTPQAEFSPAEQSFIDKYMGKSVEKLTPQLGSREQIDQIILHAQSKHGRIDYEEFRTHNEVLMVGFYLGHQEFVLPSAIVQEVIKSLPIARLPAAPQKIAGVINLRGKITPILRLRDILSVESERQSDDNFFIICREADLQVGFMIERIHTMYRVPQAEIDWDIDSHIGANTEIIAGVIKHNDRLLNIVRVDKIIETTLS